MLTKKYIVLHVRTLLKIAVNRGISHLSI